MSRPRRYLVLAICCLSLFMVGLAVFALGSLACGLAPSLGALIAFRAVQAVGSVGWRGVFWINIPIGVAAIILTALFVPESRAGKYRRPDPFGQVLVMTTLGTVSYAIIEGPDYGWASAPILACFAVAAAALAVFGWYQPRRADPLIDLRFFRSLPFSGAALTAVTGLCAFAGFLFLITLYLQDVRGYRPLIAGLFLLPMALVMACSAPLAGRVIARRGSRIPLVVAGAGIVAGGLLLTFLTATSPAWYVLLCCLVFGVGPGWLNAPITASAVAGMPRSQAGVASSITSTGRQVGSSLGVAVMVALALFTTGRTGRASAARAASLITGADDPVPARAA